MTMPTKDTVFQRKFLNASDLKGQPVVVTIKDAPLQKLKNGSGEEQQKTVLYFLGKTKGVPLNLTNWDSVAELPARMIPIIGAATRSSSTRRQRT
jgi:hypothetical protein